MTRSERTGSRSSSPRRFQWFAAWPFHARAVRALRTADMNTLIALGTFSAYLYSAAVTLWPGYFRAAGIGTHVYYDTAVMILAFILLGRLLESRARRRTGDALKALLRGVPDGAQAPGGTPTRRARRSRSTRSPTATCSRCCPGRRSRWTA